MSAVAQAPGVEAVDVRALARELATTVRGEVRFSEGSRALYANDASVYRQVPLGVVVPRTVDDVVATVAACRRHGAPIVPRGCGTGLAGQSVNTAVLIDFSKYLNALLELDPERRIARVQPGIVLDRLRDAAEEHDLTFGPDPATHSRCTLGGMIGNNSCGVHSILAGLTSDNIESLDVLLYDGTRMTLPSSLSEEELSARIDAGGREGEIYAGLRDLRDRYGDAVRARYPRIPRRVSGVNLDALLPEHGFNVAAALVGTEASCALVLEACCTLIPSPQHRSLVLLGYPDPATAADQVAEIMELGPIGLETFDRKLVENELRKGFERETELLPDGDAWLLVEFGGDSEEDAAEQARALMDAVEGGAAGSPLGARHYDDEEEIAQVWEIREGGVGHSKIPGEHPGWPSWEDAAVPPERTGEYLRDLWALCDRHGREIAAVFGHVGHGCLHTRIDFDFLTAEGVRDYRAFLEDAGDLVARYGGSLSGEHGDGQARAELLPKMFGDELVGAFAAFKRLWDPEGRMNPGKAIEPFPLDTNLRFTPDLRVHEPRTEFAFPDDGGAFSAAAERCFGVGMCRDQTGTMCPSYQVTLEEKHSTRGRARLLSELMREDSIDGGWRNEEVKEALDLCLACKGCKHECPVRVDMATYKAEFLSHFWRRRLRPRHAYAMGLIHWEARLASRFPRLANLLTQREPLARWGRRAAGVAAERTPPPFARETFRDWFGARRAPVPRPGARRVLVWPDTFTNFFEPAVGRAAVEVLEATGHEVVLPERMLCCGRPLYDYGMLDLARRQLRQLLGALHDELAAGTPVVTLEPSCGAVFRDELVSMLPHDDDAKRLARQTCSLAELLAEAVPGWTPDGVRGRRALVHLHCHQKATSDTSCDLALLERLGLETEVLDSGCCGVAGSFGYEPGEPYEISVKAGERVLLPAVRAAADDTLLVTDGFSCRSQIAHGSGRGSLHLAQVARMAMEDGR
jgi:FAD/FMN-containing dehydrogenase/Fe-S oxidoreductase